MKLCESCIHRDEEQCEEKLNSDQDVSCYGYAIDTEVLDKNFYGEKVTAAFKKAISQFSDDTDIKVINFIDDDFIDWRELKPGNVFSQEGCDEEVYLTIWFDDDIYYVRLSDAKVFDKFLFSSCGKVQRHICTLTVGNKM